MAFISSSICSLNESYITISPTFNGCILPFVQAGSDALYVMENRTLYCFVFAFCFFFEYSQLALCPFLFLSLLWSKVILVIFSYSPFFSWPICGQRCSDIGQVLGRRKIVIRLFLSGWSCLFIVIWDCFHRFMDTIDACRGGPRKFVRYFASLNSNFSATEFGHSPTIYK